MKVRFLALLAALVVAGVAATPVAAVTPRAPAGEALGALVAPAPVGLADHLGPGSCGCPPWSMPWGWSPWDAWGGSWWPMGPWWAGMPLWQISALSGGTWPWAPFYWTPQWWTYVALVGR